MSRKRSENVINPLAAPLRPSSPSFAGYGAGVDVERAAHELHARDFSFLRASDWAPDRAAAEALETFARSWDRLVVDRHMRNGDTYRQRRFCKFLVHAGTMAFEELDDFGFYQPTAINPYAGGVRRDFAPVEPQIRACEVLRDIIRTCLRVILHCERHADSQAKWKVHVHQFRIVCSQSMIGQPTPEGLHRDGHDFISMHLMDRAGIDGGTSDICDAAGRSLMRVTLRDRLDGFLINDRALLHGVSQITPSTGDAGHRDMLVVDYNR